MDLETDKPVSVVFPCLALSLSQRVFAFASKLRFSVQTVCYERYLLSPQISCIFFVQLQGLIVGHFQLGVPGYEKQLQPGRRTDPSPGIKSRDASAHRYLSIRADVRDAAEDAGVSEPRGSPASSPGNKDTQSTASLKPHFKSIKQLQRHGTAFSKLSCPPTYRQGGCPWSCFVGRPALNLGPFKVSFYIIIFILHESFTPHPSPRYLDLRAQPMET